MNPSTALATVMADELVRGGLSHAVMAPGSRSTPLVLALHERPEVDLHVEIDERSAAFCALGIAKVSAEPAAVMCTSGTATANFHPAVIEADLSRTPLLVLTADRPVELRDVGANQTIDQYRLYGSAVRWYFELSAVEPPEGGAAVWRSVVARALAEARGRPPGPVHLNVPLRVPLVPDGGSSQPESLDGRGGTAPWTVRHAAPVEPSEAEARWLADEVMATADGVLVCGEVEVDAAAASGFAAAAGWPMIAEPPSGARIGDHAISTADLMLCSPEFVDNHRASLVVVVGRPVLARSVRRWLRGMTRVVLIDADGRWLDPGRAIERILVADPSRLLANVADRLPEPRDSVWLARWCEAERAVRAAVDRRLDAQPEPSEPRLARDLAACLPSGTLLMAGSSMPVRDLASVMRPRAGLRILGNRGASGIDGFVSTTLGAALVHRGPVVALIGDLSMLHDQNGLLLAGSRDLDVVFVVVNNNGGGIFSLLEQAGLEGFETLFGTPHGVRFDQLASVYGLSYHPLARADDIAAVVGGAIEEGGLHLVEVRTDRAANAALHHELQRLAIQALN